MSSGDYESFSALVGERVAATRRVPEPARQTDDEFWAEMRRGVAAEARRRQLQEVQDGERVKPILELGRMFARTLIENGVSFEVAPPSHGQRRRRHRPTGIIPVSFPAWKVTEQRYSQEVSGTKNIMRGGEERYEYTATHSRGLAVARNGQFAVHGEMGRYSNGFPAENRPWKTHEVSVDKPILVTAAATPSDVMRAPGLPRLPQAQLSQQEIDDRMEFPEFFGLPVGNVSPPRDSGFEVLYESWKSHLVTVASRIIVAQS